MLGEGDYLTDGVGLYQVVAEDEYDWWVEDCSYAINETAPRIRIPRDVWTIANCWRKVEAGQPEGRA